MSLARRESRADFPEEVGGVRWFLSRGKHHSSRSTFHPESCSMCRESSSAGTPPDFCFFTLPSVMRRTFASGFRAGFVLSFRWMPLELNSSDKARRFFDHDYEPSKSLPHVLAQRLTRSSPARTCDQDSFLPHRCTWTLVKLTLHLTCTCPQRVSKQISSDVLCNGTGQAAPVSSQKSSVAGKNDCISGLMSHGSCAPLTFGRPPPALVGSQFFG